MSERWKMNRIGFVNFWLYDEEDFEFIDGKLLLRGQNGSGKSITTQSFIPFVLDGDRTPSRLDPFGSSDRRMEYYFLGEDGKEEATGYLFLEFKKEKSGEYRTIGIGQRAKRGKPMDFWGFIILDGKRIGYDLWLYKEVGSSKIPLDKREMRTELGEDNYFTDSQSDYKKQVNQYIFGFRKAEQYEQFIRLLVKVRAPKLSKELKPTKVYEILNDSQQTLTDEDLRTMVDAMEKMDEIQDSLDMLNRAFSDVKILRNEYTRYNQYMLAKKAQSYLAKRQEVETARKQLDSQAQKRQEIESEQKDKTLRLEELEEKKRLAETEREGLLDTDLEEMDRKLEKAKTDKEEAETQEQKWENRIQECKERIRAVEQQLGKLRDRLELGKQRLKEDKAELEEQQEILQWDQHETALRLIGTETYAQTEEIAKGIEMLKRQLEECIRTIRQYEELSGQYDEIARELEQLKAQKLRGEQDLDDAGEQVAVSMDQWITDVFEVKNVSTEWHPAEALLKELEEKIRQYRSVEDAGALQELLRADYEMQRQELINARGDREQNLKTLREGLNQVEEELARVQSREELEPERNEDAAVSRLALQEAGIAAVPFYRAVEFSDELDGTSCARLEAQLQRMGILDALVVSAGDVQKIRERCPAFLDTVLYVKERGTSDFSGLVVSESLETGLKEAVAGILSNIYEKAGKEQGIYLGRDGCFRQGVLAGKAHKAGEAEYVGQLARKKRREQRILELQGKISELTNEVSAVENEVAQINLRMDKLWQEYQRLPGFSGINAALDKERECALKLQVISGEWDKKEKQEKDLAQRKNQQYQAVLQQCKPFPYGRTKAAYDEACGALEEYRLIWQEVREELQQIESARHNCIDKEDQLARGEQDLDDAFAEKRSYGTRVKEYEIQIRQYEEYLNRPDIVEKANWLKQIKAELADISEECDKLRETLVRLDERWHALLESEPKQKERLQQAIGEETCLRNYFEEELSLKLVFERGSRTLADCAGEAAGVLRESDRTREPGDLIQSLYKVYQQHNGSLASYGTALEDCFGAAEELAGMADTGSVLRKRVRVVSVWNGKKVYLEEFYGILKAAIEETELLIQRKDRELFEDILSQTISQQLTDRIAESRKWVSDMSKLMQEIDTSMGLSFSLDWKPRGAENAGELDTAELEKILLRDRALLTVEDIEKVAAHFRSRIRMEKQRLEEDGTVINYMDLVRDALDYRKWFEFQMFFRRGEEQRKPLTNAAFNRFSGGEKAMAMYVPLFAAVNAQYQKADNEDHPRMIALDEAFAGVDDKNISSMFELVHKLDFDYIMNSQSLWGCFETVSGLRIAELLRPQNSQIVSAIRYIWNGHERILDEQ